MVETVVNTKLHSNNYAEVIKTVGGQLQNKGFVKSTYIEAVLQREGTLPTGLRTSFVNVAIPHTDVTHVNKSVVAISTLAHPVKFHMMENPAEQAEVEIVFLLAVDKPEKQTELLKSLMSIFQDEELLAQIKKANTEEEMNDVLKNSFLVEESYK